MDKTKIEEAIRSLLHEIEGEVGPRLQDTPERVARAYVEMFDGYAVDIDKLVKTFDAEGADQIVTVSDIRFNSFCEHHLLPWSGTAHVAYLPVGKVIGASKVGRLVLAYAHRLQLQERMTKQIGMTLMEKLKPQGVAVVIVGEHTCMRCRGAKLQASQLRSSVMLGEFREDRALRQEFFSLLNAR